MPPLKEAEKTDVLEIYMLATCIKEGVSLHPNKFYKVGSSGLTQALANELVYGWTDKDGNKIDPYAEPADEARARIAAEKAKAEAEMQRQNS